jgi:hypothetical protein
LPLSQPDPWATAVLVDELDACSLEHSDDYRERFSVSGVPSCFDVGDCISMKVGRFGKIPNRPI